MHCGLNINIDLIYLP